MRKPLPGKAAGQAAADLGLIERGHELNAVRTAFDDASEGAGNYLLIDGPAGIGKSALLEVAVQTAQASGLSVLRARGAELEGNMPFGVARQLLGPALMRLAPDDRTGLLGGLASEAGALLGWSQGMATPKAGEQAALVDSLYWLDFELSQRSRTGSKPPGLLVAVDDAQWSDASSLRFLLRLAVGLQEIPTILVVAVRSGESADGLVTRLRSQPDAHVLQPLALSDEAVGVLVRNAFGPGAAEEFCRACATATGGNPFLVRELLASLRADQVQATADTAPAVGELVPESVLRSVILRLARLPATARALAGVAAVLGPDMSLRLCAQVAGISVAAAAGAADALLTASLLVSSDPPVFSHPLIAEAVAAETSEVSRARTHRRAAELLSADGASTERVAVHLRLSSPGKDAWVVDILRAAGAEAMARGEAPGAMRLLERALAESPPPEVRSQLVVDLALAEAANGQVSAIELLAKASQLADDPHRRARTLQAVSRLLFARGQIDAAIRAGEQARTELVADDPLAVSILAAQLAVMVFAPGAWPEASRLLADLEAAFEPGRDGNDPLVLAQLATRRAVWGCEGRSRVRPLAEEALAVTAGPEDVWQGDASMVAALIYVDEFELAERVLERMADHARRTGSPVAASVTGHWRATLRYQQGWVSDAATEAQQVLDSAALGWSLQTPWIAAVAAQACLELEDVDSARAAIAVGEACDRTLLPYGFLLYARGEVALATGDAHRAVEDFVAAGEHLSERYSLSNPAVLPWRAGAARALASIGESGRAAELARAELADAQAIGTPHAVGTALCAVAVTTSGEEQVGLLRDAADVLEGSGSTLEYVRALCHLGTALSDTGHRRAALEPLRQARRLAGERGAVATERRAYRELRRAGGRPSPSGRGSVLTPAERRVALLAAQDQSNSQIAKSLYVSLRTVEWHLTQAYRKLGIRSRAGLSVALGNGQEESFGS